MRVSIITASFNQGKFLEQTILSVLQQSYPHIEYIVMDGGSTDNSLDIIQKYEERFSYWQSRKDRGQWDAIHQGFEKATGDVLHFLHSDDLLLEGSVERVIQVFQQQPSADIVYGKSKIIDSSGQVIDDYPSRAFDICDIYRTWENPVPQPSAFFRRKVFETYGSPLETFQFCADFEYWLRTSEQSQLVYLSEYLCSMRLHDKAKTSGMGKTHAEELLQLCNQAIQSERFQKSGVSPNASLRAAHYRASMIFRRAKEKQKALRSYFFYCKNSFPPPIALYRFARYFASMMLNRW